MPARICVFYRVVIDKRIPVPRLRPLLLRDDAVRRNEPPQRGIVEPGPVVVQPDLGLPLPGIAECRGRRP
jgi:hypothetical protein